jgi:hypothetical protein
MKAATDSVWHAAWYGASKGSQCPSVYSLLATFNKSLVSRVLKAHRIEAMNLEKNFLWRRMVCIKRFEHFFWLSALIAMLCWEFQQTVWVHLSLEAWSCSKPCRRMAWRLELFSSTLCLLSCWELQLDRLPAGDDSQCWCRRNWLNYAVLFQNAILTLTPVSRNRGEAKASSRPGRRHTVLRELLFALHYLARV